MKWLVILPALVSLVFIGHALEDGGIAGASPYIAIVILSVSYLIRPMLFSWVILFAAFVLYAIIVFLNPDDGLLHEWIIFFLIGFVPALMLWLARPQAHSVEKAFSEKRDQDLSCSFCNKHQSKVHRLIASSPTISICEQCIEDSRRILIDENVKAEVSSPIHIVLDGSVRCSFCHRIPIDEDRLLSGPSKAYICEECVRACWNLLKKEADNR